MKAILTDVTRCTGCEECVAACKDANELEEDVSYRWSAPDRLSSTRLTSIVHLPSNEFVRKQCRHCLDPACVAACPVGALRQTSEGAVVYDFHKCLGCRYCMMACPYGIPRYEWEELVPKIRKCTMCHERLVEGLQPACTEACPHEATLFGDRDELLAEAHRRIEAEPGRYIDKVFGELELGGTCVLYISNVALDFLQQGRDPGQRPMPELQAAAMKAVPPTFVAMGALMGGLHWIIGRRMKIADEQAAAARDDDLDTPAQDDAASDRSVEGG
jgi:formate dehydrogenase iron-sulfur subunit